jgi:tyrosinase
MGRPAFQHLYEVYMSKISRRTVIKATAAGLALGASPLIWLSSEAQERPRIRYEASTPQGLAMLDKYARAVALMKTKGVGDPCSWVFSWFTHWVRSDSSKSAQIALLPEGQRPLASDMWNTCQNHGGQTTEDMFLPWHRMYVYFFERIVQMTLRDPSFALPYWNYTNPATASLPRPFISPASGSNSLWADTRNPGPNNGDPLRNLNLDALRQTTYSGFCATLDNGLHGNVHVAIGNSSRGMGAVPWAAGDPIFWMHHSNIDRLWASWNAAGRTNPTSFAWLSQNFVFANDACQKVVAKVGDFSSIATLGYTYDRLEPIPRTRLSSPLPYLGDSHAVVEKTLGPVELDGQAKRVELSPPAASSKALLGTRLKGLSGERKLYLAVDDLMSNTAPGVLYNIYLNLPDGTAPADLSPFYAGTINFFGAVMLDGASKMEAPALAFDVTDLVRRLNANGGLNHTVSVTVIPDGDVAADAKPMIGTIALVEH